MKSEKFYLSLRGTNFGNRTDDVGEFLSSGMSNIILDLQIAIDKIRQIYHQTTLTGIELNNLLVKLRDYLEYIIYNLLNDVKSLITNKLLSDYGDYNTVIDYVIHIMFGSSFKNTLDKFIEQIIANPSEILGENLNDILFMFIKNLLDKIFISKSFRELIPVLTDEKIREKILPISKLLHLCITKNYLHVTKEYSYNVVSHAKHIITYLRFNPDDLIICGHSLGGGLTQYLCKLYNVSGYTFNPIGGRILSDDITLNFERPITITIPSLKNTTAEETTWTITGYVRTKTAKFLLSYFIDSVNSALELTFPGFVLTKIDLPLHIYNIVVSQDIIHKVLLSYDYNQHIGQLYICSIEKYLDFYAQSYIFNDKQLQISNITMFHSIDGLLILLNKIINKNGQKIRYVDNSIIDYHQVVFTNNYEYCSYRDNFIYFPNDIKKSGFVEKDALEKKYYDKYLKYKNKYLALKNLK